MKLPSKDAKKAKTEDAADGEEKKEVLSFWFAACFGGFSFAVGFRSDGNAFLSALDFSQTSF